MDASGYRPARYPPEVVYIQCSMRNDRPGCKRLRRPLIYVLGFALLGCVVRCEAQNLVPNGSFEFFENCPAGLGLTPGSRPIDWYSWNQSPDYFNSCAGEIGQSDTLVDIPMNGFGYQYPAEGTAYCGLRTFSVQSGYREHIGCMLNEELVVGQTYYLSFRSNLAMWGNYFGPTRAANNLGMLFTMGSNAWDGNYEEPFAFRNYAHLYDPVVNTDTVGWTLVSGSFIADSAYQYLVLGNFFEDQYTDTLHVVNSNSLGAYYFVDDVRVCATQDCADQTGLYTSTPIVLSSGLDPAGDRFEVTFAQAEPRNWWLLDPSGKQLKHGGTTAGKLKIPVSGLNTGAYILRIQGSKSPWVGRFFVVN